MSEFRLARDRDAWPTIRGFVYQIELTIDRWLRLDQDHDLELEAGEDIELTRRGETVVRLIRTAKPSGLTPDEKARVLLEISKRGRSKAAPGPGAAHAADFLYDDGTGLPA